MKTITSRLVFYGFIINALMIVLVFFPILDNPFEGWDDMGWIRDVEKRNSLSTIFHPTLITGNEGTDTSFVPVQSIIYLLMVKVFGNQVLPFHILSLFLHFIAGIMVFITANRFLKSEILSFFCLLYFTLSRGNYHVVSWVCAGIAHSFPLILFLVSLLSFIQHLYTKKYSWYFISLSSYFIAQFTKETTSILVAVLPLYEFLFFPLSLSGEHHDSLIKKIIASIGLYSKVLIHRILKYLPFLIIFFSAVFIQTLKYKTGHVNTSFGGMDFGIRMPLRLLDFLSLQLAPVNGNLDFRLILMGMIIFFTAFILKQNIANRAIIFLLVWLILMQLPFTISNFRPILGLTRYLYLPSVPFIILVSFLFQKLLKKFPSLRPELLTGMALFIITHIISTIRAVH